MNYLDYFKLPTIFDRWKKKRKVGRVEGLPKIAAYNKSLLRIFHRKLSVDPVKPTGRTVRTSDGRTEWRVWSDGSYRRTKAQTGRKLVAV